MTHTIEIATTPAAPPRYIVAPIASADCGGVRDDRPIISTDDLATAEHYVSHGTYPFGCGILDTHTGLVDVGYGFGAPCPAIEE